MIRVARPRGGEVLDRSAFAPTVKSVLPLPPGAQVGFGQTHTRGWQEWRQAPTVREPGWSPQKQPPGARASARNPHLQRGRAVWGFRQLRRIPGTWEFCARREECGTRPVGRDSLYLRTMACRSRGARMNLSLGARLPQTAEPPRPTHANPHGQTPTARTPTQGWGADPPPSRANSTGRAGTGWSGAGANFVNLSPRALVG